jgi:tetratricopeptide (TPR) repeat protein
MIVFSTKQKTLSLAVFLALGFLLYSNTFDASFHFDDAHVVSDLSFKDMVERCKSGGSRFICHLTFLFNYWLGGTDVVGYHIFNTTVHIGTAYFVFAFLFQILTLSYSDPNISEPSAHPRRFLPPLSHPVFWPAFLGGMLFLVHPLATQAVTYITQRYSSLAGFFYIGSLAFFASARIRFQEHERFLKGSHLIRYVCSFVMAVSAMRSKEMAITLPATLLLTEYCFVQSDFGAARKRILYLLPLLATGFIIPVSDIIGVETIGLESVATLQEYTWAERVSRSEYLLTQIKIILAVYLKLSVWPIGQNIDHGYVVSKTLLDLPTLGSLLFLCMILGAGLYLFRRARLVSFGILWFLVTISPTSSIVPNSEFVAEHRAYISLMGLSFAVAGLPLWRVRYKIYLSAWLLVLLVLSGLTYSRNAIWKTEVTLWTDCVLKSPLRARGHSNLGLALARQGSHDKAIPLYYKALRNSGARCNNPYCAEVHNNLGLALEITGSYAEAIFHYSATLHMAPDFAEPHANLGNVLMRQGSYDKAIAHYYKALRMKPDFWLRIKPDLAKAHYNLGAVLTRQGSYDKAIVHYSEALRIKPDHAKARRNLQLVLRLAGK